LYKTHSPAAGMMLEHLLVAFKDSKSFNSLCWGRCFS